jgi:Holliday junction resolvasome RuvABC ATP-dependent DNA helicase subunit
MGENMEQLMARLDMDEQFDAEISLKRLIGNDSARAILQLHIDQFYNERVAGLNPQLSPILLIGGKGTGVHSFARSISNSLASLCFHTVSGTWLSDGVIYLHSFIGEGEDETYYIAGDKLSSNIQMQLWKMLTERKLFYYDFESLSWKKKPLSGNKLIILSTEKKESISYPLLKQFKIQVNLTKLTVDEIELALRQRVSLLGWTISSPELLSKIAQSCSEIGSAMQVLSMAHLVVRSKNEDILTEKQLNVALHLLDKNIKAANLNKSS